MTQITDFGKAVLHKLIDSDMDRKTLAAAVHEKTGLFCDEKYLSRIFNGHRNAPKIKAAICEILGMEEE